MINAIIFDWGGVLIENPPLKVIPIFAEQLYVPEEQLESVYKKYEDVFQRGKITENEYWDRICGDLNIEKPHFVSLWKFGFKKAYIEKKEVFKLISGLKNNGYQIGFLSNSEIPSMELFMEHNYDLFDEIVFSCQEGLRKPEKEIYEIILTKLKVTPDEAVFIDDNKKNLIGAEKVGINTILFSDIEQLKNDLRALSIKLKSNES